MTLIIRIALILISQTSFAQENCQKLFSHSYSFQEMETFHTLPVNNRIEAVKEMQNRDPEEIESFFRQHGMIHSLYLRKQYWDESAPDFTLDLRDGNDITSGDKPYLVDSQPALSANKGNILVYETQGQPVFLKILHRHPRIREPMKDFLQQLENAYVDEAIGNARVIEFGYVNASRLPKEHRDRALIYDGLYILMENVAPDGDYIENKGNYIDPVNSHISKLTFTSEMIKKYFTSKHFQDLGKSFAGAVYWQIDYNDSSLLFTGKGRAVWVDSAYWESNSRTDIAKRFTDYLQNLPSELHIYIPDAISAFENELRTKYPQLGEDINNLMLIVNSSRDEF